MEYLRRCYTTFARPFRDRLDITVPIVWYWAAPDAKVFPSHHHYGTLDKEPDLRLSPRDQVGEVIGAPRAFRTGGAPWPEGLPGLRYCGTAEDFLRGAVYDPRRRSPMIGGALPACCYCVGRGGELQGGDAIVVPTFGGQLEAVMSPPLATGRLWAMSGGEKDDGTAGDTAGLHVMSGGEKDGGGGY